MTIAVEIADRPSRSPATTPAPSRPALFPGWAAVLVGLLGLVERLWFASAPLNGDEGVPGVMVRSFLHGHFTTFVWGQQYGGTLEIFSTMPSQWLLGDSRWALHLPELVWAGAIALLVWRVALRLVTPARARWAAGLWWVAPLPAVAVQQMAYMFYSALTAIGLVVVLYVLRIGQGSDRFSDRAMLGVAFGLGWWESPTAIVYFAIPAAIWMAIEHPRRIRGAIAVPAAFAVLAATPWLVTNFHTGFTSFVSDRVNEGGYVDHLASFFEQLLPTVFGVRLLTGGWVWGLAGALAFLVVLVAIGFAVRRALLGRSIDGIAIVVYPFVLAAYPALLQQHSFRYVIFLVPFLAICISRVLVTRAARIAAVAITVVLTAMAVLPADGTVVRERFDTNAGSEGLITQLQRIGHTRGFATYSAAYPVMYESGGRLVLSPLNAVRSKSIDEQVRSVSRPVYIFPTPAPYDTVAFEPVFRRGLRRIGVHARRIDIDGFHIYVPDERVVPEDVYRTYNRARWLG